jgi:hypothetical protein
MTHSILNADFAGERSGGEPERVFGYDVDGASYEYDQPTITGAQLRFVAGLHPRQALVRVLQDGSRVTVTASETVALGSGARFFRRPRFTRG